MRHENIGWTEINIDKQEFLRGNEILNAHFNNFEEENKPDRIQHWFMKQAIREMRNETIFDREENRAPVRPRPANPVRPRAPLIPERGTVTALSPALTGEEIAQLPQTTEYFKEFFRRHPGYPNVMNELGYVMDEVPQVNGANYLMYLVSAGLSVDIITHYKRKHKDVDLVLLNSDTQERSDIFSYTDNVSADRFWADMKLNPEFLAQTTFPAHSRDLGRRVLCVHPGITLVQKVSNAWGRDPREHDIHDANALGYWILGQPKPRQEFDIAVAKAALSALPPSERTRTENRLDTMFEHHKDVLKGVEATPKKSEKTKEKLRTRIKNRLLGTPAH